MESIEYYSACPQCGAANVGNEKCDYCGASLIKIKTTHKEMPGKTDEEEAYYQEDSRYPEIKGRLLEKDEFLFFFCPLFGGIFLLVPTIILVAFSQVGILELWVVAMLSVFWLVGIGGIMPLILYFVRKAKCRNGKEITGIVRGYEKTMIVVNGSPVLAVRVLIDQWTSPKILILNTGSSRRGYPLGKEIRLKVYKNNFMIVENRLEL